jgi:hypothetical protein
MKIGNEVARRARHREWCAPAQVIRIKRSSRAVVSANTREPGNLRKNSAHSRFKFGAPNIGVISITGLENHRRAARATALEIHLAPGADVYEIGKIVRGGF